MRADCYYVVMIFGAITTFGVFYTAAGHLVYAYSTPEPWVVPVGAVITLLTIVLVVSGRSCVRQHKERKERLKFERNLIERSQRYEALQKQGSVERMEPPSQSMVAGAYQSLTVKRAMKRACSSPTHAPPRHSPRSSPLRPPRKPSCGSSTRHSGPDVPEVISRSILKGYIESQRKEGARELHFIQIKDDLGLVSETTRKKLYRVLQALVADEILVRKGSIYVIVG
jgi:hypothetical protein